MHDTYNITHIIKKKHIVILTDEEQAFDNIQHSFIRKSPTKLNARELFFFFLPDKWYQRNAVPKNIMVIVECFLSETGREARIFYFFTPTMYRSPYLVQ